ncbi:MAG TPA: LysR family transcriptional regulator [Polyangiaceae bacterium]
MQRSLSSRSAFDWDDVRLFLALYRSRTVAAAGQRLGVDASTVSRRLTGLEESLAATLFQRGRSGITPTLAADDLLPVAEQIEEAMGRFASAAQGLEREVTGLVRVTCPPDAAEVVLVPLLPELIERHPSLRIELAPSEALADLTRREADIALRVVRPERGELIVTRLFTLKWTLAAAPELARSLGTLRSWTDAPWISWGEGRGHVPAARWRTQHVARDPSVCSDSLRLQIALATAGAGVVLVPEPSLDHFGLVPVRLGAALREEAAAWPSDDVFLVTHQMLREVPRVKAVWQHLVEHLGDHGASRQRSKSSK